MCSEYRLPPLDIGFRIATIMGEHWAYILFAIICFFIDRKITLHLAIIGIICLGISPVLKFFFSHPRPAYQFVSYFEEQFIPVKGVIPHVGYTSFPSGHTLAAFALYATLSMYVKNKNIQIVFFTCALIVGFSRIYLGHHFLKDAMFGSVIGYLIALLAFPYFRHSPKDTFKSSP